MKKGKWYVLVIMLVVMSWSMIPTGASAGSAGDIKATMEAVNEQLEAMGEDIRLEIVEYFTARDEAGQTVYFDDRTKQLGHHWVPGDPRRGGYSEIYWLSDMIEGTATGVTLADTQLAVSSAMTTWDSVKCSTIPLIQLPDDGTDWGYVQWLIGMGGIPGWYADYTHAGWLPGSFFDAIGGPGASDYILGATFTFVWVDAGNYTDIDNNRKLDVAFRETYYNNKFQWGINTGWPIDVETVVLHETGHGLSQDHFGKLFETDANGKFHFAPRAVMNAGYTGVQQDLTATDIGGHCSIWARWPNK